jgi:diacylglycerol kinase family enzyme
MRITLMHNPKAGDARHDKKTLLNALAKAGHTVTYQSTRKDNYKKVLNKPTDLVLAAGGDGTVAKVACELIETGIPLAVLPLGTANNLARTLGFLASHGEIIERLEGGKKRVVDVGVARGPWGKRYFFEGTGAGLLADYLQHARKKEKKKEKTKTMSKEQELTKHVSMLRQILHDHPAGKWKIEIDNEDVSDRYILWEAMNIRSVGPALYLAPRATTKDGQFEFVSVREHERELFMEHLAARLADKKSKFRLPTRKFRQLRTVWTGSTIHLDGKSWPAKNQKPGRFRKIEINVKPSALIIWQPV